MATPVALSEKRQVCTWGKGTEGLLGHNNRKSEWSPRRVNPKRFGGEKVVFVAAGGFHTVVVTGGEWLYNWGQVVQGCSGDRRW